MRLDVSLRSRRRSRCMSPTILAYATLTALVAVPATAQDDAARYDSPEAAVKALIDAAKSGEKDAVRKIFGSITEELESGDEVQDREAIADFGRRISTAHRVQKNENGTITILVGKNEHPF